MSDRISYVLEVLDGYSKHTKKFKKEIISLNSLFRKLDKQVIKTGSSFSRLNSFSGLNRTSAQTRNLARSIDSVNQANVRSIAISKRAGKRTFAGAHTPVKFDPYEGKYVGKFQKPSALGYGMAGAFGGMSTTRAMLAPMGIMGGAYMVGKSVKYVHDTTVQMDGLRASLSALIPKVKGLEGSTPDKEVNYLRGAADKYGMDFSTISQSYVKMLATGGPIDSNLAKGLVEAIGGYGSLINLSSPALTDTMRGFQDMLTKQTLQAQEVKLQMQQLPGIQPLIHKAFRKVATRSGIAGITPENESQMFMQAMASGKLSSAPILRQLIIEIFDEFGAKMLEKANKLGNEEKRLVNATQELATQFGDLTYEMQIGSVRGLTGALKGFNDQITTLSNSFKVIDQVFGDSKFFKILGGMAGGLGTVMTSGVSELVKAPFKTAHDLGGVIAAGAIGDKEGGRQIMKDWINYYFGTGSTQNTNQNNQPQEVVVKIVGENIPQGMSIKQERNMMSGNRPQTVIAGGR